MYTLYSMAGSCSTGIHTLLNALNEPVKIIPRSEVENYQAIVPTNQVPALQDGDELLTEGAAIVLYLLDKHQVDLNKFGGATDFRQWLMFCYATLHPAYSKLFTVLGGMDDSKAKQAFYQVLADKTEQLWAIIEKRLETNTYIMGDTPCIIDYLMAIYASWGNVFPELTIKLGSNIKRLLNQVAQLPEFTLAYEKEGATFSIPVNS